LVEKNLGIPFRTIFGREKPQNSVPNHFRNRKNFELCSESFSEEKKLGEKTTFVHCFLKLRYFAEFRYVPFRFAEEKNLGIPFRTISRKRKTLGIPFLTISRKRKTSEFRSEPFLGREKLSEFRSEPILGRETPSEFCSEQFLGREKPS
jgi:hypothetical protein